MFTPENFAGCGINLGKSPGGATTAQLCYMVAEGLDLPPQLADKIWEWCQEEDFTSTNGNWMSWIGPQMDKGRIDQDILFSWSFCLQELKDQAIDMAIHIAQKVLQQLGNRKKVGEGQMSKSAKRRWRAKRVRYRFKLAEWARE